MLPRAAIRLSRSGTRAAGRLRAHQPFQVAEHHGPPKSLGKLVDLLVENAERFGPNRGIGSLFRGGFDFQAAAGRRGGQSDRDSHRDAVQPRGQGRAAGDAAGLAGQHQEDGLEGILRVLVVPQKAAASGKHHRPVPPDE